MFDYAGCLHLHSTYSYDGRVPVPEIIASAQRAGLDYAVIADHFRLDARQEGWEGYHGDGKRLLMIVGEEISPRYNHYLALGIRDPVVVSRTPEHAQDYIDTVNAQ